MGQCVVEGCDNKSVCRKMCHKHYSRWQRNGNPLICKTDLRPAEERFWKYVNKTDGCWFWTGFLNMNGYGRIARGGKANGMEAAHRFSYRLHKGDPGRLVVMHECDNPACVNPDHLVLGTQKENVADMIAKGRGNWRCPAGEGNPNSKLTEVIVREIRSSSEAGKDIAKRLGVSTTTVSDVRRRRLWQHVT